MQKKTEYWRYIVIICYYEDRDCKNGCSSGKSLAHLALENIKLVNYEDRVIATVILAEIYLLLRLYSVSTLDLKFYIYRVSQK